MDSPHESVGEVLHKGVDLAPVVVDAPGPEEEKEAEEEDVVRLRLVRGSRLCAGESDAVQCLCFVGY